MKTFPAAFFSLVPGRLRSAGHADDRLGLPLAGPRRGLLLACGLLGGLLTACGEEAAAPPADPKGPPRPPMGVPTGDPDCPPETVCEDHPAAYAIRDPKTGSYGNYDLANRPVDGMEVRYIVIHTTDTTWDVAIQIFQDAQNGAAAHYLVRSRDGQIAKFISPHDVAWHAGNWYYNMHSIGIEHEAWAFEGYHWFTDAQYAASAKLVRHLARRYGVPLDRAHILGHDEVPGINPTRQKTMHWDPGPYWDWDRYMKLLHATTDSPQGTEPADEHPDTGADAAGQVIAIRPDYAHNLQDVSYCYSPDEASDCHAAPRNPVHFLYLRQAPDPLAPVITNPYLTAWPGDRSFNWGNKVGTGTRWVRAERSGDWDAIFFSGQKAWFYNPDRRSTRVTQATRVTPKAGLATVPVYGVGYPQAAAFPAPMTPVAIEKNYEIAAGQQYVVTQRYTADYYWAKTYVPRDQVASSHSQIVVQDGTEYFQINFNHREGLVRVADMDIVTGP